MLTLVRGRKTSHTLFLFKQEPRISQRRNPCSSSFLEAGTEVLLQAEQNKKEMRAKPVRGDTANPTVPLAWRGGACVCCATPWKAGREVKSPVSWYSYYKHRV